MSVQSATLSLVEENPEQDLFNIEILVDDTQQFLTLSIGPRVINPPVGESTITWTLAQQSGTTGWSIDGITGNGIDAEPQGESWMCSWTNCWTNPSSKDPLTRDRQIGLSYEDKIRCFFLLVT